MINIGGDSHIVSIGTQIQDRVMIGTDLVWEYFNGATNLSANNITQTSMQINWVAGRAAIDYTLERKETANATWNVVGTTTSTTLESSGLLPGTSYDHRIITNGSSQTKTSSVLTTSTNNLVVIRPNSDISVGDWTTAPIWSKISDGNDLVFASSSNNNGSVVEVGLGTPPISSGGVVHITRKRGTGARLPDFTWEIIQDGTTIVQSNTVTISSNTFVDTQTALSFTMQAGGNYSFRMTRTGGGNPRDRASVDVGDVWIELN